MSILEDNIIVIIALRVIPSMCSIRMPCSYKKSLCVLILDTCEFEIGVTYIIELPDSLIIMLACEELWQRNFYSSGTNP